jgi:SP family facilitated glucose transporter-like MFS transporter 8
MENRITSRDLAWIASALNIGSTISCLFTGCLMNTFGRQRAMLLLTIPFTLGWIIITWSQNFWMFFFGRLLIGLAGGAFFISIPQYTSEISDEVVRGTLGTFFQLFLNLGILFVYVVGALADRLFVLNLICGILPVIFAAIFVFMPESPYYLIHKSEFKKGEDSLKWLRSGHNLEDIKRELLEQNSKVNFKEFFKKRSAIRGLIVTVGLVFFFQTSGINAVMFFTVDIFEVIGAQWIFFYYSWPNLIILYVITNSQIFSLKMIQNFLFLMFPSFGILYLPFLVELD